MSLIALWVIYMKNKGFVKTVYGQGSDWANSILFASANGSCLIPDALVYWRFSGDNITSIAHQHKSEMIIGHFQFILWILNHFSYLKKNRPGEYIKIKQAALENHGLSVVEVLPITTLATEENLRYLETKRDKMGHLLPTALAS